MKQEAPGSLYQLNYDSIVRKRKKSKSSIKGVTHNFIDICNKNIQTILFSFYNGFKIEAKQNHMLYKLFTIMKYK